MQGLHRFVDAPLDKLRQDRKRISISRLDGSQICHGRLVQNVVDHLVAIARMTDTDADTKKVTAAEVINDIAQTVMPAVTTRLLDAVGAGWQVQFIVDHQDFLGCDLVVARERRNRLAAAIHEGLWLLQKHITPMCLEFTFLGIKAFFKSKAQAQLGRDLVKQPEARIVAGINVIGPGVTEADY